MHLYNRWEHVVSSSEVTKKQKKNLQYNLWECGQKQPETKKLQLSTCESISTSYVFTNWQSLLQKTVAVQI